MKRGTEEEEEDTDEEVYVYAVGKKKQPMCRLEIAGEYVALMLDSRGSVNLVDEVTYQRIYKGNSSASQTANFILWIIHTPTPARNHSRQVNCKM